MRHVCLSFRQHRIIRLHPPPPTRTWNFFLRKFFRKSVRKNRAWLQCDNNNGYFIWRRTHIYDNIPSNSFLSREIFSEKICHRKIKTLILIYIRVYIYIYIYILNLSLWVTVGGKEITIKGCAEKMRVAHRTTRTTGTRSEHHHTYGFRTSNIQGVFKKRTNFCYKDSIAHFTAF